MASKSLFAVLAGIAFTLTVALMIEMRFAGSLPPSLEQERRKVFRSFYIGGGLTTGCAIAGVCLIGSQTTQHARHFSTTSYLSRLNAAEHAHGPRRQLSALARVGQPGRRWARGGRRSLTTCRVDAALWHCTSHSFGTMNRCDRPYAASDRVRTCDDRGNGR
jgi:hypothetical protein